MARGGAPAEFKDSDDLFDSGGEGEDIDSDREEQDISSSISRTGIGTGKTPVLVDMLSNFITENINSVAYEAIVWLKDCMEKGWSYEVTKQTTEEKLHELLELQSSSDSNACLEYTIELYLTVLGSFPVLLYPGPPPHGDDNPDDFIGGGGGEPSDNQPFIFGSNATNVTNSEMW